MSRMVEHSVCWPWTFALFPSSAGRVCISRGSRECLSMKQHRLIYLGICIQDDKSVQELRGLAFWQEEKTAFPPAFRTENGHLRRSRQRYAGSISGGAKGQTSKSTRPRRPPHLPSSHHSCGRGFLTRFQRQLQPDATEIGPPEQIDDDEALSGPHQTTDVRGYRR